MINLFRGRDYNSYGVTTPGHFNNLDRVIKHNIYRLEDYYNNLERRVKNNNILVRMIKFARIDLTMTHTELLTYLTNLLPIMYRQFEVISHLKNGELNYITVENYDNYFLIDNASYSNARILTVLYSTNLDDGLSLNHHTLFDNTNTIYGLDIRALLISYFYWAKNRKFIELSKDPSVFIYQIPVMNVIKDSFDYSLFRIILNTLVNNSRQSYVINNKNPLSLQGYTSFLNNYIDNISKDIYIARKTLRQEKLLKWIHLPFTGNAYTLLNRDYGFINRNNQSAVYSIEGNLLLNIMSIQGDKIAMSRSHNLRIDLNIMKRDIFGQNITLRNGLLNHKLSILKNKIRRY